MIYIACDMNCNNFGNFFRIVGHEREVKKDSTGGYMVKSDHYPEGHCYRCKSSQRDSFRYSEAIDVLHPDEFVRWIKTRFGISEFIGRILNELKFRTDGRKDRYLSLMDMIALIEILEKPNHKGE